MSGCVSLSIIYIIMSHINSDTSAITLFSLHCKMCVLSLWAMLHIGQLSFNRFFPLNSHHFYSYFFTDPFIHKYFSSSGTSFPALPSEDEFTKPWNVFFGIFIIVANFYTIVYVLSFYTKNVVNLKRLNVLHIIWYPILVWCVGSWLSFGIRCDLLQISLLVYTLCSSMYPL